MSAYFIHSTHILLRPIHSPLSNVNELRSRETNGIDQYFLCYELSHHNGEVTGPDQKGVWFHLEEMKDAMTFVLCSFSITIYYAFWR
jgi:hypothetical protein